MKSKLVKEASRLASKGEYLDAGDLYRDAGEFEKALTMYSRAKAFSRSAALLEWLGKKKEAAVFFAKANQFAKAAELLKESKEYFEAGMMYKKANIPLLAAEMFHLAEAFSDAASMYEKAKDFQKAGELYMRRGIYGKAVVCFETILNSIYYEGKLNQDGIPIKHIIRQMCAEAYEKLGRFDIAADYYFKCDRLDDAIRLCDLQENHLKAAQFLEKAGELEAALKRYILIGDHEKADRIRIQLALQKKNFKEAGALAEKSEDYTVAAEAFELAGMFEKAAEMYRMVEDYHKAALLYLKAGKSLDAAILFERIGSLTEAAKIREHLGEHTKASELYFKNGHYVKAAKIKLKNGLYEEAIAILQFAWKKNIRNTEIRNLLGYAFLKQGEFDIAYQNYLKSMTMEPVSEKNIEILYEIAEQLEQRHEYDRAVQIFRRIFSFDFYYKDVRKKVKQLNSQISFKRRSTTVQKQFTPGRLVAERYIIQEKIGAGGMGFVYRAQDKELGIDVALKVLKQKYSNDDEMVQRFKREVTLARQIHHENVVQLYDFGKIMNVLYISMEFFPSKDLKSIIHAQGPLPINELIPIMTQVCKGLWAAHLRGIVHRDIKPQNILINDQGIVKLVDFGIATMIGPTGDLESEFVVGTPDYMSPEQAQGAPTDPRSDIYSFGTILYEAAVGRPPFLNKDSFQILVDQVEKKPIPPRELNMFIPTWLNDLILKCLQKNPDDRYESIQVVERQLSTCGIAELMLKSHEDEEESEDDDF